MCVHAVWSCYATYSWQRVCAGRNTYLVSICFLFRVEIEAAHQKSLAKLAAKAGKLTSKTVGYVFIAYRSAGPLQCTLMLATLTVYTCMAVCALCKGYIECYFDVHGAVSLLLWTASLNMLYCNVTTFLMCFPCVRACVCVRACMCACVCVCGDLLQYCTYPSLYLCISSCYTCLGL